jgi:pSer/pThr/pTyr-binding forkhead associated (FHA) protein
MPARVTFTVASGEPLGREYVFSTRTAGAIGRAADCLVKLPNDLWHLNVSRHHCQIEVDPPGVRVHDLGSRNGTFLNGEKIGQRPHGEDGEAFAWVALPSFRLHDGDELRVGDTLFRVTTTVWGEDTEPEHDGSEVQEAVFG